MKKSIGILTLHRAQNYGAVWQCFALKSICEKLGFVVHVVDYSPFGFWEYRYLFNRKIWKCLPKMLRLFHFNSFVNDYLAPICHSESHDWIKQNIPECDYFIVGSDTVWCKQTVGEYLNSYLFDWLPKNKKRIAYAASLGGINSFDEDKKLWINELPKFRKISVREPLFIGELEKYARQTIQDVCDPSLLLSADDYQKVETTQWCLPKHYMVLFALSGGSLIEKTTLLLKKKLKIPIVNISGKYTLAADRNCICLSPQRWLYVMRNADFICTNSFHGTAFAIVFRRPFVTCAASVGGRSKTNGRVENLLTQCGLMNRYITDINDINHLEKLDYSTFETKIEFYRKRSFEWLKKAIDT